MMNKTDMPKIIEIKSVTAYRGETRVFDNLSLEIEQGQNTAILGPNGAGKTTLMKLLSRDLYPVAREESSVRVFGRERWNVWELRSHFGIVSNDLQQEYIESAKGLNVILSGYYSSIDTWQHQHFSAEEIEKAEAVIEQLGITHLKDRPFGTLSTGQQRRFLLGRALIHDPDALLLDEPTSGLDLKASFQYLYLIRSLMHAGKTVILVTHHIHEIPPEITRVVLIKDGKIVADGEKSEVLRSETLSNLFDVELYLVEANGFYQAMPR
ncbi:MAG: ATP-binding cassette domain-containing protein [Chlorobiales bacterium]|nr:ATP-binding cassette domain-containing protein [Chlorobiales bacterium]